MMKQLVHIVDPFDVAWSGSALEALALCDLLHEQADVRLWAHGRLDACYSSYPVQPIAGDSAPAGGTPVSPRHFTGVAGSADLIFTP